MHRLTVQEIILLQSCVRTRYSHAGEIDIAALEAYRKKCDDLYGKLVEMEIEAEKIEKENKS